MMSYGRLKCKSVEIVGLLLVDFEGRCNISTKQHHRLLDINYPPIEKKHI